MADLALGQGRPIFLSDGSYLIFKNVCGPQFKPWRHYISDYNHNLKNRIIFFCYFSFLAYHIHAKSKVKAKHPRTRTARINTNA